MKTLFKKPKATSSPPPAPEVPKDADFGWRVHAAILDWTKNVDQKASITLAIITGVGGLAATQVFGDKGSLHAIQGDQLWAIRVMGAAFLAAGFFALYAVFPNLKRRRTKELSNTGLIFFGHLRHRSVDDIRSALTALEDNEVRQQLASQLHATSDIAWKKHARLQAAHILLAIAIIAFAVAELW